MTQLDDLAFVLMAAGGAADSEKSGSHLLYVDPETSSLVSKFWPGGDEELGQPEIIAESARLNSKASYIIGESIRLIVYISSSDELRVSEFDSDSDEWFDDEAIPHYKVHPVGHLSAVLFANDRIRIIFQDSSARFNILDKVDGSWTPTIIPVEPTAGSPIGSWICDDQLHLFYVSAKDNCLHYVVEEAGGSWNDVALPTCVFDKLKPIRLTVLPGVTTEKLFQVYVISEANTNTLWKFLAETKALQKLGSMDGNKLVPDNSEECYPLLWALAGGGGGLNYSNNFNNSRFTYAPRNTFINISPQFTRNSYRPNFHPRFYY
jgi:hypothetical protein